MAEGLTKYQIEIITKEVSKIQERKSNEKKKERRNWKLRNTQLLLKNYQLLKKHCDGIIPTLEVYQDSIFNQEELDLAMLMKYKARTKEMLDYFDLMFSSYSQYCHNQGPMAERRLGVVSKLYTFENKAFHLTKSEVADYYAIDARTVDRDIKKSSEELSIFLFGIDSLDDLSHVLFVS
ncbi:hypothetical protein [Enterococcus sp. AZ103]|uniref:hypothetical protein n=1 Tax=Enterococcus sp. AZ103 TaxID=2774628 RepID=UPI003F290AEF